MKELLKDLLTVLVALVIFAAGFYLGSHPALIAATAAQIGLSDLYTSIAPAIGLTSTQGSTAQAVAANAAGVAAPGGTFAISEDQTFEIVAATGAETDRRAVTSTAEVSADGVVVAADSESVTVPVDGKIAEIAVKEGDTVAVGDVLFALDTTALETKVQNALAELQQAADKGESDADAQRVADAQTALEVAAQNLAAAQVTSPVAGTVTSVQIESGQPATAYSAAVVLTTSSALDVSATVPMDTAAELSVGQPVTITVDGLPGIQFTGTVAEIAQIDAPNVPVLVHLGDDALGEVLANMKATVLFAVARDDTGNNSSFSGNGWLVPSTAVQDRNGTQMVFVVRDERPQPVQVTTGMTQGDQIVIQSDELQAGDRVVLDMASFFGGGQFQRGTGQFPGNGTGQSPRNGDVSGSDTPQTQPQN